MTLPRVAEGVGAECMFLEAAELGLAQFGTRIGSWKYITSLGTYNKIYIYT